MSDNEHGNPEQNPNQGKGQRGEVSTAPEKMEVGEENNKVVPNGSKDNGNNKPNPITVYKWKGFSKTDVIIASATVIIAVVGIFQTSTIKSQLGEMQKAGGQTDCAIMQFARSADIADNTLRKTKELAEQDRRAWIVAEDIKGTTLEIGKPFKFIVIFKNTGKTPGIKVRQKSSAVTMDKTSYPVLNIEEPSTDRGSVIPPNGTVHLDLEFIKTVTKKDVDELHSHSTFIYGKIVYEDIFSKAHWSTFCAEYVPSEGNFMICRKYNEIDDN